MLDTTSRPFKVQVEKKHYYNDYDTIFRFISYNLQAQLVLGLNPNKVLEIGVGNKTIVNYLSEAGIEVETVDFDEQLKPDIVADIRSLPIEANKYDVVMACEILEHIPWEDVPKALSEISRVTKKYAVISIPYSAFSFESVYALPFLQGLIKKPYIRLGFQIPFFFISSKFNGQHYWEMGQRKYSMRKVYAAFESKFRIITMKKPLLNPYHCFFVLEKLS